MSTRMEFNLSLRGLEGWSLCPGWATGSTQEGREANLERDISAKMTESLVTSNKVTVSGLTTT